MLRKLLFTTLITATILGALEFAMRLNYYKKGWPSIFRTHPILGFENRPNWQGVYSDQKVVINNVGCRDHLNLNRKKEGQFRILILGDSVTFGFGTKYQEIYPYLLQKKFIEDGQKHVRIVNAGVNGYDTFHESLWFDAYKNVIQPDLVIVAIVLNDLTPQHLQNKFNMLGIRNRNSSEVIERMVENSALMYWIQRRLMPKNIDHKNFNNFIDLKEIKDQSTQPESVSYVCDNLKLIKKSAQAFHAPVVTLVFPGKDQIHQKSPPQIQLNLDQNIKKMNIKNIDLWHAFHQSSSDDLYLPYDDCHLTFKGHQLVVDRIYNDLKAMVSKQNILNLNQSL